MPTSVLSEFLRRLRGSALPPGGTEPTDGQLLEAFVRRQDRQALEGLVRRHAPVVWGVCRRALATHHDAEDAFQAAFLVLVRKAASIRSPDLLANWLYRVAHQTAVKARQAAAKRCAREKPMAGTPEPETGSHDAEFGPEAQALLDEELRRLPDKYRIAILVCDLEGRSRAEAAQQLGLPPGTVASRLVRGRALLAKRLLRRGVGVSAGSSAASGSVPAALLANTTKAAALFAAGEPTAAGAISAPVSALMEAVLKASALAKQRAAGVVLLIAAVALTGVGVEAGWWAWRPPATPAPAPKSYPPAAEKEETLPIADAVIDHESEKLPEGAAVLRGDLNLAAQLGGLFTEALDRANKGKLIFASGTPLKLLAAGPTLDSPDEAAVVKLTRRGGRLDLEIAYTSAVARGEVLKQNVPWRPLVTVPVELPPDNPNALPRKVQRSRDGVVQEGLEFGGPYELPPGRYTLTVTWRAVETLPDGKPHDVKPTVSTAAFTVLEGRKESKPAAVNGVEFRAYVQGQVQAPAAGGWLNAIDLAHLNASDVAEKIQVANFNGIPESKAIDLGLRVTNATDKALTFKLTDAVWPVLKTADGKELRMSRGREVTGPCPPIAVDAGASADVSRDCDLQRPEGETDLRLSGPDATGFLWCFDGLKPGKYALSFRYQNDDPGTDQAFWVGKATTEEVTFEILDDRNDWRPARLQGREFTAPAAARVAAATAGQARDVRRAADGTAGVGLREVRLLGSGN
jgi:RNA polymerase sigma factor (sigma-70 family)